MCGSVSCVHSLDHECPKRVPKDHCDILKNRENLRAAVFNKLSSLAGTAC
jgi:hypothetical protein